jgi:hypothetical protein
MDSSGFCPVLLSFSMEKQGLLTSSVGIAEAENTEMNTMNNTSDPIVRSKHRSFAGFCK